MDQQRMVTFQLPIVNKSDSTMTAPLRPNTQPQPTPQQPQLTLQSPTVNFTVTRLQCIANYKLRLEASRQEHRLCRLLGHISIYDKVRDWRQSQSHQSPQLQTQTHTSRASNLPQIEEKPENELLQYLHLHTAPPFADFQAAIEDQLSALAKIRAASQKLREMAVESSTGEWAIEDEVEAEEYSSDSDTESDYDSHDDHDDDEGAESEDSMTDPESVRSECTSPVDKGEAKEDYFELEPLTPLVRGTVHF